MFRNDKIYSDFVSDFTRYMYGLKSDEPFKEYIFLCVGSDRVLGDSFGPLVGEKLKNSFINKYNNLFVMGTLEKPVCATNLETEINNIYLNNKKPCVIAIDSALSSEKDIGKIIVNNQKIQLGKSMRGKTRLIGDISIRGIVAKDYRIPTSNFKSLQSA